MSPATTIPKPGRVQTAFTTRFWEAADHGVLLLQLCINCGRHQLYPRPFCSDCWSEGLVWRGAQGTGKIWTFTVADQAGHPAWAHEAPYVIAVVELDEGPRMLTNVVDCEPDEVAVGRRVRIRPHAETPLSFTLV